MDDASLEKIFQFLLQEILRLNKNISDLRAGIYVLKATVAGLTQEDPKEVFAQMEKAEERVLASDLSSAKLKEAVELLEIWKKHPPKLDPDS